MAGIKFSVKPAAVVACVASTADTIIQLTAPANQRVIVDTIVVSFNGITAADPPILVQVLLQTDVGSGGTSVTPVKSEQSLSETIQSTCVSGPTTEPTGTTVYHSEHIHEQGGVVLAIPRRSIVIKGGERLGVRMTPGTLTAATSGICTIHAEE